MAVRHSCGIPGYPIASPATGRAGRGWYMPRTTVKVKSLVSSQIGRSAQDVIECVRRASLVGSCVRQSRADSKRDTRREAIGIDLSCPRDALSGRRPTRRDASIVASDLFHNPLFLGLHVDQMHCSAFGRGIFGLRLRLRTCERVLISHTAIGS